MQDLVTHPMMKAARKAFIAGRVEAAEQEAQSWGGVISYRDSDSGQSDYTAYGQSVSDEAAEEAEIEFDGVLNSFIKETEKFVPGALCKEGFVCDSAIEWAIYEYEPVSLDEEEIINIIYGVINQTKASVKEAA